MAPDIIWNRSSSTLASRPGGTVTIAVADCASAPIAKMSPSAWLAATMPKTYGSSMKARKKSTECTTALPGGTRTTAASSGACRPISTSSRSIGRRPPSARLSTEAPTFAPQPPQRIAIAEIACAASSSPSRMDGGCARGASGIAGNSLNLAMKRRSIQSFQRQTHRPWKPSAPREATAYWSPVLISASQRFCGR